MSENPFSDDASLASRSSLSGSLLDRIRAQRERESGSTANPEPLNPPNYAPVQPNVNPSSEGWTMGGFSLPRFGTSDIERNDAAMSLLGDDDEHHGEEPYSMTGYFMTFIQDVYNGFRSIHPAGQGFIIFFLIILAVRLLL